ncbi:heat shock protein 70 [Tribonema minus]|uniref:Heat shock protein 70 n=1 Tax=Tribonema minus TaxID=303371 RepID=A0A835YWZ3_9STRA|nr:heat shock protein 70 [Tribonema minus]
MTMAGKARTALAGALLCLVSLASANVIGVDLGTDFMKVALVAPRRPLEIVTNTASKRKTAMAINFDRGERSFGGDALVMLARKPAQTFTKLTALLGRHEDHPDIKALESTGLPPLSWNATRGGLELRLKDRGQESTYMPEELTAMMLSHAHEMTHMFGYNVPDAVITVPSYWTAHERLALADAVELSALNALSFIDENTAAALQYAIDRPKDKPHNVLFYNMGAGSTQVSVVTYGPKMVKDSNVGQFTLRGKAWDTSLGGHWFDLALTDLLATQFNLKWGGGDVRDHPRAMARLRSQAAKVKQVLSANMEIPVTVEQLHADIDFNTLVTRAQFEVAAADLFDRVTAPIDAALAAANLTLADVHEVEIVGGGVRVPRVQELLSAHLPLPLSVHLNGDEAFALGAAFAGANASRAFHVRQVGMSDITPFAVDLHLADAPRATAATAGGNVFSNMLHKLDGKEKEGGEDGEGVGEAEFKRSVPLYAVNAPVSARKAITIKHTRDLRANVTYADANPYLPAGTQTMIASFNITGVEKFAAETLADGLGVPKVTLRFAMDATGVPTLVEAFAEVPVQKEVTYEEVVEVEDEPAPAANDTAADAAAVDGDAAAAKAEGGEEVEAAAAVAGDKEGGEDAAAAAEGAKEGDAEGDKEGEGAGKKGDAKKKKGDKKADKKGDKKKKEKPKKKKTKTVTRTKMVTSSRRRALEVERHFSYSELRPMTAEEKAAAKTRLGALAAADAARHAKAAAKNDLEAYILMVRNAAGEDAKKELKAVTTEEQREELVTLANQLEEWLYDDGWDEEASVYKAKKLELSAPAEAAFHRMKEATARPAEVKRARLFIGKVRETCEGWKTKKPHITDEERQDLLEKLDKVDKWLVDKEDAQAALAPHAPPAFASKDVEPQLKTVQALLQRLNKKPAPKVEKPAQNETATAAAADSESADGGEKAEGGEDAATAPAEEGEAAEGAGGQERDAAAEGAEKPAEEPRDEL